MTEPNPQTCKYCPYEFTDDTLATIAHLRTHADLFAEQGSAKSKLRDLDRWERNHRPLSTVDRAQAWFWTPEWQAGEREADEQIACGEGKSYFLSEGFLESLES